MVDRVIIKGSNDADTLTGTDAAETIYGFDPDGPSQTVSLTASRVASGLSQALFTTSSPTDPNQLFVVQKTGQIRVVDLTTGQVQSKAFLDVSSQVSTSGEQGLLGFAFDPNYAANRKVYVYMSNQAGDVEIRQYSTMSGSLEVDPASAKLIKTIDFAAGTERHRGGWIGFGPDGYLYVAVGDGTRSANAQDLSNPMGKILRLDVSRDAFPSDPNRNYALPDDNPSHIDGIAGDATGTGIYAAGLRNPWRVSFDRLTNELYIADVGESTAEEVNIGRAGANYGWPGTEGGFDPDDHPDYTQPIHFYGRTEGRSITGGYVYRGENEALQGHYVFGDYATGRIWTLDDSTGTWKVTQHSVGVDAGAINRPTSFGEDSLGNLYVVDYDGEIFRLNPQASPGGSIDQGDTINARGGDDMVYGGAGNDTIDGGTGVDTMIGGQGDDRYIIDNAADVIVEGIAEGTDTIRSSVSYTLTDAMHVEVLWTKNTSGTTAINFTGNNHDNRISGNAAGNILSGLGGDDLIKGLNGNDTLIGGAGEDDLRGEEGNDRLEGGLDADHIEGGIGTDVMLGGGGADIFIWDDISETSPTLSAADVVLDFNGAGGDRLDISDIDANTGRSGGQAFAFIGTAAFTAAAQVRYEVSGGQTIILLNTDADSAAEGVIRLEGVHSMQAGWFDL
ncbi:PQQ-dependent sugar dehydrogenase [Microvirga solisilvae]|uniref:PQQ-dependent sugar dehydrogenase n=1 Tax=Microvirga solisilvae TaxID=2919498 RepID=UPI001FAFF3FF|nr:PQQ-dependent sugar dehydrogenase [Microvirga solisilvae]